MFFPFIKYITPTWYFNITTKERSIYVVDYDLLNDYEKQLIKLDNLFSCINISKLDAAYQAFQKGIIKTSADFELKVLSEPTISDNYRFVKKYFHPFWVYYIFFIRIICLNNPIFEILALFKTRNTVRVNLFIDIFENGSYEEYTSSLVKSNPKISVIIPTLNRYKYLKDVLIDLENQTYKNFEVLIFDQSTPYDGDFYVDWNLEIYVVNQNEKALWLARNTAIQESKGDYILLYDDDSLVESDWIEQHLKCIDYFKADISSGVSLSVVGAKIPNHYRFFRWSDQVDTGNVMIKKKVFLTTGLFDKQFEKQRQGDGEWGLRAYLAGFKNISNPLSKRLHLKVSEGGLREMGSWDAFRPKNIFAPRPVPSVLYLIRNYFGRLAALNTILISVPPSFLPYKYKKSNYKFIFGFFLYLFFAPVMLYVVLKAWRKSTKMLKEGHKISKLE